MTLRGVHSRCSRNVEFSSCPLNARCPVASAKPLRTNNRMARPASQAADMVISTCILLRLTDPLRHSLERSRRGWLAVPLLSGHWFDAIIQGMKGEGNPMHTSP